MTQKHLITAAYYFTFILPGFTIAAEGATLLQLAEHTNSALDQISLIFFFGSLGYLIGSYASGRIYDRLPGLRYMTVVFAALIPFTALIPVVRKCLKRQTLKVVTRHGVDSRHDERRVGRGMQYPLAVDP